MKTYILMIFVFLYADTFAQVQFSSGGSLLKGSGYYDNHAYLLGGGASMKYVFKDQFLIGITGRIYQANTTAYDRYNSSDKEQNISGSFEAIFNKKKILKPYLGIDAGVSQASRMINYYRFTSQVTIVALRGGLYYSLGQSTGLFSQVQYNYTTNPPRPTDVPGVVNEVLTEPLQKYWTLDAGLYIRLYVK